jgi:hypothetical protein
MAGPPAAFRRTDLTPDEIQARRIAFLHENEQNNATIEEDTNMHLSEIQAIRNFYDIHDTDPVRTHPHKRQRFIEWLEERLDTVNNWLAEPHALTPTMRIINYHVMNAARDIYKTEIARQRDLLEHADWYSAFHRFLTANQNRLQRQLPMNVPKQSNKRKRQAKK